jgi:hypothetical protein
MELTTLDEAFRFAQYVVAAGFAPKGLEKAESVLIAVQMGRELGLPPMAALQNIAIINGRPGVFGDAALALVRGSGLLVSYSQAWEGTGDARLAKVTARRKGDVADTVQTFSVQDAKKAGLWGKQGPWSQYPDRMLLFRARGFILRDMFGDVLKGFKTTEELADTPPPEKNITGEATAGAPSSYTGTARPAPVMRPAAVQPESGGQSAEQKNAKNTARRRAVVVIAESRGLTVTPDMNADAIEALIASKTGEVKPDAETPPPAAAPDPDAKAPNPEGGPFAAPVVKGSASDFLG